MRDKYLNTHIHTPRNAAEQELTENAQQFRDTAERLGLKSVRVWTGKFRGQNAVCFGSDDLWEKVALEIQLFGEEAGTRNHRYAHAFLLQDNNSNGSKYGGFRAAWLRCIHSVAKQQKIILNHTDKGERICVFTFDSRSDRAYFELLACGGTFDAMVQAMDTGLPYGRDTFLTERVKPPYVRPTRPRHTGSCCSTESGSVQIIRYGHNTRGTLTRTPLDLSPSS